eukprot:scaffold54371_cov51-Cyclotella_meneghiniana.AAC.2
MECQNKGLWHLGISDEACENAGGKWFRTACLTLKDTIDNRPSRFDLDNPIDGSCQDNLNRLETAVVSASTAHSDFPFGATQNGCHEFCRSLPDYSQQIGMMTHRIESEDTLSYCTCIYRNDKLPSRDVMPSYSKPSPHKFTLTNSDGMALGLRPKIDCDATDDLMIETQVADSNNPRQQFQITQDGQVVSVRCPKKMLTNMLGSGGTSCTDGVGLQLKEYGWKSLGAQPTVLDTTPDQYGQQVYDPSNTNQAKNKATQSSELDTFYHQIKLQGPPRMTKRPSTRPTDRPTVQPTAPPASDLQRWAFNKDGSISNVACPNLAISSSKQKDVSLNSIYFALQNPRTQLAIGISAESCEDGMTLTMQDLVYGNPNQQFVYIEADKKIVSVKCPKFAITIPNEDCDTTENLLMSSNQNVGDRNKWLFDNKEIIQSVQCPNKFITISGALSGGTRLVTVSNKFLKEETPDSTTSHSPMKAVGEPQETPGNTSFAGPPEQKDATKSPTAAYTKKDQKSGTEWEPATPPSVGSTVILSDLNAERYQKWTKQRQVGLLQDVLGISLDT